MNIACLGDLHIDSKTPVSRKDDFSHTQFEKFRWCLDNALDNHCSAFCMPGDIFNHPRVSLDVVEKYIRLLRERMEHWLTPMRFFAVYGQHDLYFHAMSSASKTPLNLMEASGVLKIVGNEPICIDDAGTPIRFYGASWDCDIPKVADGGVNVLLIHTMMIGETKVWEGQEDYSQARSFLRENKFDLVVSGDNHQQFYYSNVSGKSLVNAGSLMRARVDQIHHEPAMFVYNTVERKLDRFPIPCPSYSEVIDTERSEEIKERDERIEAFVESLNSNYDTTGINFRRNMDSFLKSNQISKQVTEIISKCMEASNG